MVLSGGLLLKSNVFSHLVRVMWQHSPGLRGSIVLYLTLSVLAIGVQLLTPLVMAELMNDLQVLSGPALAEQARRLLLCYLALGFLFWFLHGPSRLLETAVAYRVKLTLQDSLMRKITALPMGWHKEHHSGSIIDQVARAVYALGEFCEGGFEILHMGARFFGSILLLMWFAPEIGLGMLGMAGLVAVVILLFDRYLVPQYEALNNANSQVAAAIQDYLTNISTVLSLRLEGRVVTEIRARSSAVYPLYQGSNAVNELKWFSTSRVIDMAQAGFLLYLILSVPKGTAVGSVYAVSEYLKLLGEVFLTFTWKYSRLVSQSTRLRGIDYIEEDFGRLIGGSAHASLPQDWKELHISGLAFDYGEGDGSTNSNLKEKSQEQPSMSPSVPLQGETEVKSLSIRIDQLRLQRGQSYAVIGESGGGKSTFLSLLRGLHQPLVQPQVECDGQSLPHGLAHINHHATLIPQHPEIFSDTLLFNITVGVACPQERVLEAVQLAQFQKVLEKMPEGLNTHIAEKGVNLSGGERQRLALARGIFFEGEIHSGLVLLDEPTSSVDSTNEKIIYQNLLRQFAGQCLLSALHKHYLLPLFDRVLRFEQGQITFDGTVPDYLKLLDQPEIRQPD